MAEAEVIKKAEQFTEKWNATLAAAPRLKLDYSWPTVAVCDLLLFPLRNKPRFDEKDQELLAGCAAYLGVVAKRCWSTFAPSVTLRMGTRGIAIKATGGSFIPADEYIDYPIQAALQQCLLDPAGEVSVLGEQRKQLTPGGNLISICALGIVTGLGPARLGAWEKKSEKEMGEVLDLVLKYLATTCAAHYARLNPDEPFGQMAELYLDGLLYPPIQVEETVAGVRAVERLLTFFAAYEVKSQSIAQLVFNLANLPDEQLSCTGLALFGAVSSQTPPVALLASAQARGPVMAKLRPAMLAVRKRLGLAADWATTGFFDHHALARIRIEQNMGFLPLLYFDVEKLVDHPQASLLTELLAAIADGKVESALKAAEQAAAAAPVWKFELLIQRAKLELSAGRLEAATTLCREASASPDAQTSARYQALVGLCALQARDSETARFHFEKAAALPNSDPLLQIDISNNLGWTLLMLGEPSKALAAFDAGISKATCPVTLLLNKAYALWQQKDLQTLASVREQLFDLAPIDRRVFASLIVKL